MQRRVRIILLSLIVILAAAVRLYNLSSIAPSPFLDEVSNGYNAYSILKTGSDEYGRHLPLLLQAYNDFRPALFVYLTVPFVALFGLTTFAIRLPAVLLHVLTTVSIYFLTYYLCTLPGSKGTLSRDSQFIVHGRSRSKSGNRELLTLNYTPLFAAFLYAISPWSIYSSRMSDEINMSLSFFVFALTFFLSWLRQTNENYKSAIKFFLSILMLIIAFYAYHGIKFFIPFFILGLVLIYYKKLWQRKKTVSSGIIIGAILLIPLLIAFMAPGTTVRLGAVNIFTQNPDIITLSSKRVLYDKIHHDIIGEFFDNRRFLLLLQVLQNYLRNLDLSWLFLQQGNRTFMVPDFGPFYLFEIPLLLVGIYFIIKETIAREIKLLLILWIAASIIPSAISGESPHLNRTNTMLPALTILEALGLYGVLTAVSHLRRIYSKYAGYTAICLIIMISFVHFLHAYFVEFPFVHAKDFQYGTIQAFAYAKQHENQYQKIIVSNGNNLLEGYMYYLFVNVYDPATYQKQGGTHSAFFTDTHLIGKYDFRDPNVYEPKSSGKPQNILYITNPGELSPTIQNHEGAFVIQRYQFPNGSDAIWIWKGKI